MSKEHTEPVTIVCRERIDCPEHRMEESGVIDGTGQEITVCHNCGWTDPAGSDHLLAQSGQYEFEETKEKEP